MQQMGGGRMPFPPNAPAQFRLMAVVFEYFGIIAMLQVAFGVFVIFAGVQFLKLQAWARTALETVSWLGLLYIVGFGIFWLISWTSMTTMAGPGNVQGRAPAALQVIGTVMGIVVLSVFAVPTIIVIKVLRGKPIREAVSG